MESRHTNVWSRHSPHMLSRSCFKVVWFRGHHHGLPQILCSLGQGQPQCLFLIHDQIPVSPQQWGTWWTAKSGEGGQGGPLQNWHSCVEMAVGCGFTACKYMIDRTISLNEALFYVLLNCICMCLFWLLLLLIKKSILLKKIVLPVLTISSKKKYIYIYIYIYIYMYRSAFIISVVLVITSNSY